MDLQRFQDISSAVDIATFKRQLEWFTSHLGFERYNASMVYGANQPNANVLFVSVNNTPEAFVTCNNVDNSRRDPVNQKLRDMQVPFFYDSRVYEAAGAGDLWEEQAPFGYRTGIAVAMHMPGAKHFLLGLDRTADLPSEPAQLTRLLADLQMLAVHAQVSADTLLSARSLDTGEVTLTKRERQVLQYAMDGKSYWVIGQLLNISENGVKFHMRNLMAKLECSTRAQAVMKALDRGLL